MTSYTIVGVPCIGSLLAQMYCIANCIFEWFSLSRCGPSKILKWNECVLILYICFCTMMVGEGVEGTHQKKICCIQIFVTNMIHLCPKDFLLCGKNEFNPPPPPRTHPSSCWQGLYGKLGLNFIHCCMNYVGAHYLPQLEYLLSIHK